MGKAGGQLQVIPCEGNDPFAVAQFEGLTGRATVQCNRAASQETKARPSYPVLCGFGSA